jgi:hypothetical protein
MEGKESVAEERNRLKRQREERDDRQSTRCFLSLLFALSFARANARVLSLSRGSRDRRGAAARVRAVEVERRRGRREEEEEDEEEGHSSKEFDEK